MLKCAKCTKLVLIWRFLLALGSNHALNAHSEGCRPKAEHHRRAGLNVVFTQWVASVAAHTQCCMVVSLPPPQPAGPSEEADDGKRRTGGAAEEREGREGPIQGGRSFVAEREWEYKGTCTNVCVCLCAGAPAQHRAGEHQAECGAADAEGGGAEPRGDHRSVPGGAGAAAGLRGPAGRPGEGAAGGPSGQGGHQAHTDTHRLNVHCLDPHTQTESCC